MEELTTALDRSMEPVLPHLPGKRLREVAKLAVQGVIGGQSPLVTQKARGVAREDETVWPMAKRLYRFLWNKRFSHCDLLKGLYGTGQHTVATHAPARLVVAIDPVNFETPYTKKLEDVSTVNYPAASCGASSGMFTILGAAAPKHPAGHSSPQQAGGHPGKPSDGRGIALKALWQVILLESQRRATGKAISN
jgi:hypothetical protein